MTVSLSGCFDDDSYTDTQQEMSTAAEEAADAVQHEKSEQDPSSPAVQPETDSTKRTRRTEEIPMGEDGTWTVMVYMCGSDLESEGAMASIDIAEMMDSSADENVRFLVCTGGAKKWNNGVDADKTQIYCIYNGDAELVYETDRRNMAESSTLSDFLRFGVENYPAARMGLIMWDHGSGSIDGVCYDEFNYGDSLFLKEVDAALFSVYDEMTASFEFIGFDACLMSTLETAAMAASHSRYMIASEETEPGSGWDYTRIGDFLAGAPDSNGAELGKVICDSFYESCRKGGCEDGVTLSVIDLTKIDGIMTAFDSYAKDIYELTDNTADLSKVIRNISASDNFGGNNKSTHYTNMVDLRGIIKGGEGYSANAAAAVSALENAVVYTKNGRDHKDACGLSCYYPLQINGSQELGIFRDICVSPYYLGFVDKIAYGAANAGDIGGYDNSSVISSFLGGWSEDGYDTAENYSYTPETEEQWSIFDEVSHSAESELITFDTGPTFDEDGTYGFILSEEGLNNTKSVEAAVYMMTDDLTEMIELGYTGDILCDWDEGIFVDNFDGCWFSLPDGQLIAVYLMMECDGYDVYSSPVMLNGKETNLIIAYDYEETEVYFMSVWDGISETGAAARADKELEKGDTIVPLYYSYNIDTDEEDYYYGDEYIYDGESEPGFNYLYDGEYIYGFIITDIFGNTYETDYINFTVDEDKIYFDTLE